MSFVNVLKRTLTLPAWLLRAPAPELEAATLPPATRELPRVLMAHATGCGAQKQACPYDVDAWMGSDEEVKLFVHAMGVESLLFRTSASVEPGQSLEVELLLPNLGVWRGTAVIDWTLASVGGVRGQATLSSAMPQDRDRLGLFLEGLRQGVRSSRR